jgi:hypothetical protein
LISDSEGELGPAAGLIEATGVRLVRQRSTSPEHSPMKQSASHPVCRAAKSLPVGIWHPSVMQFYSGPLIHFLSGVDTGHVLIGIYPKIFQNNSTKMLIFN